MSLQAQLVLLTGRHSGLVASILPGYYLVGRSSRCQIRPRTRSVSREHCLLYFGNETPQPITSQEESVILVDSTRNDDLRRIHVLDLGSTSGTQLDGETIPTRQWCEIVSGSKLQCGKIAWKVIVCNPSLQDESHSSPTSSTNACHDDASVFDDTPTTNEGEDSSSDIIADSTISSRLDLSVDNLQSSTFQEAAVAEFLLAHDDVDRERRRKVIRATIQQNDAQVNQYGLAHEVVSDPDSANEIQSKPMMVSDANFRQTTTLGKHQPDTSESPKGIIERSTSTFAVATPTWETTKLILVFIFTIAVLGIGIYHVIQLRSGAPVRVYDGLG